MPHAPKLEALEGPPIRKANIRNRIAESLKFLVLKMALSLNMLIVLGDYAPLVRSCRNSSAFSKKMTWPDKLPTSVTIRADAPITLHKLREDSISQHPVGARREGLRQIESSDGPDRPHPFRASPQRFAGTFVRAPHRGRRSAHGPFS